MIFADEKMVFRRAVAEFDQLRRGPIVEVFHFGPVGRNREYVKVSQLRGFLRPERFEGIRRIGPPLDEEVTQAQKIAWLRRIWLVPNDRFEWRRRQQIFTLPVVREADIQTNA